MKFSKSIPLVFVFLISCAAPVTSVPTRTLMPEPTATQTLAPPPTEAPTNTPIPERFTVKNLTKIPKNKEQIKNCPLIASPWDEEQFKKDIDQALYSGAGLQTLNDWKGYTIEIPSPAGVIGANYEGASMYGITIDPAACLRFIDYQNRDAVLLALPAVHVGKMSYLLTAPNPDDTGKWESATTKTTVNGLLSELPLKVTNVATFYTAVQTDKGGTIEANTPFLTSILSLPSQQGTGEDLRTCIVSNEAQADIARLAYDRLRYKVLIWGNTQ
jgi:hypothetical protein